VVISQQQNFNIVSVVITRVAVGVVVVIMDRSLGQPTRPFHVNVLWQKCGSKTVSFLYFVFLLFVVCCE